LGLKKRAREREREKRDEESIPEERRKETGREDRCTINLFNFQKECFQ
jgi:hypothetical protein